MTPADERHGKVVVGRGKALGQKMTAPGAGDPFREDHLGNFSGLLEPDASMVWRSVDDGAGFYP